MLARTRTLVEARGGRPSEVGVWGQPAGFEGTPAAVHHAAMRNRGAGFDALADDLDASVAELIATVGQDPAWWERGRPGRWTVGQHAAHVGITLGRTADDFEGAERALRAGTLATVPAKRALLHRLFLALVAGRGYMPRGLKTADWAVSRGQPERRATLDVLRQGAERHHALGRRLDAGELDRLWIVNPFMARWHYRLPEMVRLHAVHVRHHAKQIAEIVAGA